MTNMAFTSMPTDYIGQMKIILDLFNKWSECEQTVVIIKLLKLLPAIYLKFVLSTIEQKFTESTENEKIQNEENEANNKLHLTKLYEQYKMTTPESDCYLVGDLMNFNNNNNYHHFDVAKNKETILQRFSRYTPLLKCGNDDAKKVYLLLIPYMVEDARRGIVNTKIVQQILSFFLIHPALNDFDRQSLRESNKTLQEHIRNSIQTEQYNSNNWQIVAPPGMLNSSLSLSSTSSSHRMQEVHFRSTENLWETQSVPFSHDHTDGSGGSCDLFHVIAQPNDLNSSKSTDDHHVSFSKNGTEILDFDPDLEREPIQFTYDYYTMPTLNDHNAIKTRRSNSLTTGTFGVHSDQFSATITSSNENLSSLSTLSLLKPRSYSLSIESPRSSVTSSSSETRLNDFNPQAQAFQMRHVGMRNMGVWLKSLRLHKYGCIFAPLTYEKMLEVDEKYLEKENVTQGARRKLMISIVDLKSRYTNLDQMEQDLKNGTITLDIAINKLSEMIKTPMKPIDAVNNDFVAMKFLSVLDLVFNVMTSKPINSYDLDMVHLLMMVLHGALQHEAFEKQQEQFQLRDYQNHLNEVKRQFPSRHNYNKNGSNVSVTNPNKARRASAPKPHNKAGNDIKTHRKNSNPMTNSNFPFSQPNGGAGKPNKQLHSNTNYYVPSSTGYNKSSSYPSFNSSGTMPHGNQHHGYHHPHRHSVTNLITIMPNQTTDSIVTTQSASMLHHQPKSTINFIAPKIAPKPTISNSHSQFSNNCLTMSIGSPLTATVTTTKHSQNNNNNNTSNVNLNTNGRSNSFSVVVGKSVVSGGADLNSGHELSLKMVDQVIN